MVKLQCYFLLRNYVPVFNAEKFEEMTVVNKEGQEEHPRPGMSKDMIFPGIREEYIIQVFEQIEGRVTKNVPHVFSRTEKRAIRCTSEIG